MSNEPVTAKDAFTFLLQRYAEAVIPDDPAGQYLKQKFAEMQVKPPTPTQEEPLQLSRAATAILAAPPDPPVKLSRSEGQKKAWAERRARKAQEVA